MKIEIKGNLDVLSNSLPILNDLLIFGKNLDTGIIETIMNKHNDIIDSFIELDVGFIFYLKNKDRYDIIIRKNSIRIEVK